jgi:hypothetical protein
MRSKLRTLLTMSALALCPCACGGGQASSTVFDPAGATNSAPVDLTSKRLEVAYPPLDAAGAEGEPWIGVSVLQGHVRLSRPSTWQVRDAGLEPGHTFIRYVSPNAYSFALYERTDDPENAWRKILEHYEADLTANGAKAIGQNVPVATPSNQGRAYTVDRKIQSKEPVLSRSREILLRGDHDIVLVQIVVEEENLSRVAGEILEVLRRIEVL